jgi:hypothetical protein
VNTYGYVGGNPVNQIDPNGTNVVTGYNEGGIGGAIAAIMNGEAIFDKPLQCDAPPPQECDPPEGTICWEKSTAQVSHGGYQERWNLYQMQRKRPTNICEWQYRGGKIVGNINNIRNGEGVLISPPPTEMQECKTYPNFSGRPPHAPR